MWLLDLHCSSHSFPVPIGLAEKHAIMLVGQTPLKCYKHKNQIWYSREAINLSNYMPPTSLTIGKRKRKSYVEFNQRANSFSFMLAKIFSKGNVTMACNY